MKKIALLLLVAILFSVTACKKTPEPENSDSSKSDTPISKLTDSMDCKDSFVKFSTDDSISYKTEYNVTPTNIDIKALADQGYYVKIDATFDVYYEKDFNVPFDISYLGAPDHDVHLVDSHEQGTKKENLSTSTDAISETISLTISAKTLLSETVYLKVLTYNTQNIVYFKNIKVTYTCQKSAT